MEKEYEIDNEEVDIFKEDDENNFFKMLALIFAFLLSLCYFCFTNLM